MDRYVERLQTLSDSGLKREWNEETGKHRLQIEHEMARRFIQSTKPLPVHYLNKFLDLPDQFLNAYYAKEWAKAKRIYDTAITLGMFLEIPEPLRKEFFGLSDEDEEEIQGMIPRDMVSRVYLECVVKDKLGFECEVYRIPGEIGFYGAKPSKETRHMATEENPAFWLQRDRDG